MSDEEKYQLIDTLAMFVIELKTKFKKLPPEVEKIIHDTAEYLDNEMRD